ncbi:2,3-bisphosphoglycerate-independent phosphoglycerate mutase [Tenacibaculum sp. IB213877]|uniref:2,3-bisphosphoglycerate-independent phosphoglycerate mutase n=1 Tax=Tenacibaculum sp. IB213877 TaxID=3097351 RepID=UPI002A5A22D1|nr:2,3-bisphosphoglycerate-independent phosphoglycerate mutase [Tenacibaculum sp. IB213877]MDY0780912.1 2,3-bisphosphoglycerate-independent phosphoglycerate mutase [Tenacibaculum sp. IB213877]
MNKKVILMILDGWGITQDPKVSAIYNAKTPFINSLYEKYPNAELRTDGEHVGLPVGQMGNSEVGHMNLGAGRIVYQNLAKINKAVDEGTLAKEEELLKAFEYAKTNNKNIHFLGLVSDGGIHSHINHLKGLLSAADNYGLENVYLHAFTDGRDCDPKSGKYFINDIQEYMQQTTGELASITGRYYAMDRDNRWERVSLAYNALVKGEGKHSTNAEVSILNSYKEGVTDEFIKPIIMVDENDQPKTTIQEDDVVIFFNFRTDRGRQLTDALSQQDFPEYNMKKLPLYFVTMTNYDDTFKGIHVIYDNKNIEKTLGEVLSKAGKQQIRIAETEKYPHVTFFFSGGREKEFEGEKRLLCPSPKVATYDLKPEMSAYEIRDAIVPELEKGEVDFVCLNFANGDMVGHTGVFEAAVKACEAVDICVKDVITTALENDYTTLLIADHGNCETMINPDGTPHTAHTTNPVPFIVIDKDITSVKSGILGDIAPTILRLMNVEQPKEMTQHSLI